MTFRVVWRPVAGGDWFEQDFVGFDSVESVEKAVRALYGRWPHTFHVFYYSIVEDDES